MTIRKEALPEHVVRSDQSPVSAIVTDPHAGLRDWMPRREKTTNDGIPPGISRRPRRGRNVNHKKVRRLWRDEVVRVRQCR